jgi:hypothetical protein
MTRDSNEAAGHALLRWRASSAPFFVGRRDRRSDHHATSHWRMRIRSAGLTLDPTMNSTHTTWKEEDWR